MVRAAILGGLLLAACEAPEAPDAGVDGAVVGSTCARQGVCPEGTRCARDGVAEIDFEPEERGVCTPEAAVLGRDAPRWWFRPGGPPLAHRLCLAQGLWPGAGTTARRRELVRGTGARVIRLDFRWDEIEPERGRFVLDGHDVMVDAAREDGLEVLGILAYGNPWASAATEDDRFVPPDDPADFARYAGEIAARFAGRVRRWEVWNEQNAGYRFWRPSLHGDAAAYGALLAATADAIHGACADCEVIAGGLFFHEQVVNGAIEFTHDMLTARPDALARVDAVGLHPYPRYPPRDPPELDGPDARSMGAMITDLGGVLARHAIERAPIAITELGWPSYDVVDEDAQARLLSRAMLLGAALGADPVCWFNVTDGPLHGTSPPEDDFGLYRFGSEDDAQPIAPKPARDAMAWLAAIGAEAAFTGVADDPSLFAPSAGRFALDFGDWRVLWALEPHDVALPDETRRAFDHLGRPVLPEGETWTVGPSPLFFVP